MNDRMTNHSDSVVTTSSSTESASVGVMDDASQREAFLTSNPEPDFLREPELYAFRCFIERLCKAVSLHGERAFYLDIER